MAANVTRGQKKKMGDLATEEDKSSRCKETLGLSCSDVVVWVCTIHKIKLVGIQRKKRKNMKNWTLVLGNTPRTWSDLIPLLYWSKFIWYLNIFVQ